MKKKLLIALAVLITCGVVFAAAKTTFYTILDMTNHKITNVATPTANADAATKGYADGNLTKANTNLYAEKSVLTTAINSKLSKAGGTMTGAIDMGGKKISSLGTPVANGDATTKEYVDLADSTKLSLSGGMMLGAINMGGRRVYGLPSPSSRTDAATKEYVDGIVLGDVGGYQYFAMRKGNSYIPLRNYNAASTNYWATFVVLKQFKGKPQVWVENCDCTATNFDNRLSKTWRVGETFNIEIYPSPDAYANTNGTIMIDAGNGVVGNFGFTFPPRTSPPPPPTFRMYISDESYGDNAPVNVYGLVSGENLTIGITNTTATAANLGIAFSRAKLYINDNTRETKVISGEYTWTAPSDGSETTQGPIFVPAKGCEWITLNLPGYEENTGGIRWSFRISPDGDVWYSFGPIYSPSN